MKPPTVQSGCMDCTLVTNHHTSSRAITAATAHVTEQPTHRPMISDTNGWHRVWIDPQNHAQRYTENE